MNKLAQLYLLSVSIFFVPIFASSPAKIPQSYKANALAQTKETFEKLKALKQCQTKWDSSQKASETYRKLAYAAAIAVGHPCPEMIMLLNVPNETASGACTIKGSEGRAVHFDEKYWDKQPKAHRWMAMLHELAHLALKHHTKKCEIIDKAADEYEKTYSQFKNFINTDLQLLKLKNEYEADRIASRASKCEECCREMAERYFSHHRLSSDFQLYPDIKKLSIFKLNKNVPLNEKRAFLLASIKKMNFEQLTTYIDECEPASKALCLTGKDEHPLSIERALRLLRYAHSDGINGKLCKYHQKEIDNAKQKAKEAALKDARAKALNDEKAAEKKAVAKKDPKPAATPAVPKAKKDPSKDQKHPVARKPMQRVSQPPVAKKLGVPYVRAVAK